jgi:hypothetical protein
MQENINTISKPLGTEINIARNCLKEVASFSSPPQLVKDIMDAVCYLLGYSKVDWSVSKKLIMGSQFLETLQSLIPLKVSLANKRKAENILRRFNEQQTLSVSMAIAAI